MPAADRELAPRARAAGKLAPRAADRRPRPAEGRRSAVGPGRFRRGRGYGTNRCASRRRRAG